MISPEIENSVNVDGHVVLGDGRLLRNVDGDLFQALNILDPVNHWDEEVEPWLQYCVIPPHPLHHLTLFQ